MQDQQHYERHKQIVVDVERQAFVQHSKGYGFHNSILRDAQSGEKINECHYQEQPMYDFLK
jgi:hypothetical protein